MVVSRINLLCDRGGVIVHVAVVNHYSILVSSLYYSNVIRDR